MTSGSTSAKMASYLSRLNPVPAFPDYTGPYKVGTVDVEIPVANLESPSFTPANADGIHTVQFRIYYPTDPAATGKCISWLPAPQRSHISAYTQFLGIGPILAEFVSFLPRHLNYTTIPALKNANLLEPNTTSGRWPTMIFSHGLGGSRNAYSHVAGSVASHGVVVICPEHRDGSAVVSFIRDPANQDRFFRRNTRSEVQYRRIPHVDTPEVAHLRDQQLRIRLWELGLVHDALLRIDEAEVESGLPNLNGSTPRAALAQFAGKLQVHHPGDIVWAGHSFGCSTVVQLLKTTYYADEPSVRKIADPLFAPRAGTRLRAQITEKSPTVLLDMWAFPLLSKAQRVLFRLPLPVYADVPSAPGGTGLLAVESETFYKWTAHLHTTAKLLSPDPTADVVSSAAYQRPSSGVRLPEPNVFYVQQSAHLNQSDFGLLFPWLTKKVFGAAEPERAIRLNLRAILQMLRMNNVPVARTWVGDLVDGADVDKLGGPSASSASTSSTKAKFGDRGLQDGIHDDKAIFNRSSDTKIDCWTWIDLVGLGAESADREGSSLHSPQRDGLAAVEAINQQEDAVETEMEPHLGSPVMKASRAVANSNMSAVSLVAVSAN